MQTKSLFITSKKFREIFNQFYFKTIKFGPKAIELHQIAQSDPELLHDYITMCEANEDAIFLNRLMIAVLCAQDPKKEEVLNKLLDE